MKVLILGGSGMLGHKAWQTFAPRFDRYATFRGTAGEYRNFGILDEITRSRRSRGPKTLIEHRKKIPKAQ